MCMHAIITMVTSTYTYHLYHLPGASSERVHPSALLCCTCTRTLFPSSVVQQQCCSEVVLQCCSEVHMADVWRTYVHMQFFSSSCIATTMHCKRSTHISIAFPLQQPCIASVALTFPETHRERLPQCQGTSRRHQPIHNTTLTLANTQVHAI